MIWIFEKLSEAERNDLQKLNPLMDYHYSIVRRETGFQTYHDVREDKRFARLFPIDSVRQGFICDDVLEAQRLSAFISREIGIDRFGDIAKRHPMILDYLNWEANPVQIRMIALSVRAYLNWYQSVQPSLLDRLNRHDLEKWEIDLS